MTCLLCGASPVDLHHITGRLCADGPYLDPELVVPLCRRHHHGIHQIWRILGLDVIEDPEEARRRRIAHLAARVRRVGRPVVLDHVVRQAFADVLGLPIGQAA
jgi:hypothetical protein